MVEKNDTIKNYNKKRRMHNILPNKRAGDGNRTHVISLGSWSSAIELHPRVFPAVIRSVLYFSFALLSTA